MKKHFLSILLVVFTGSLWAQSDMDLLLKEYNKRSVPYISVDELHKNTVDYLLLDTRKKEEYDISHIPGAIWVSEKVNDSIYAFAQVSKTQPIVVYCSVGIRSEDFGEQLLEQGFENVHNLYGSIFAWKDAGYNVVNLDNTPTDSIHVFSKTWGRYLKSGIKISSTSNE